MQIASPSPTWPEAVGTVVGAALLAAAVLAGVPASGVKADAAVATARVGPTYTTLEGPSPWRALEIRVSDADRLSPARAAFWGLPVSLGEADAAVLEAVPGIGRRLAATILTARDEAGGFSSWAEVDAVPGVGPALLARLQAAFVLGEADR